MTAEQHKAVVRRYFEEFHGRRADAVLDEIMAADLADPADDRRRRRRLPLRSAARGGPRASAALFAELRSPTYPAVLERGV